MKFDRYIQMSYEFEINTNKMIRLVVSQLEKINIEMKNRK